MGQKQKDDSKVAQKGQKGQQEIDPRFAKVKYDAAFQKMDKSVNKVKVDKRFQEMFDKKKFGAGSTKVDKYGRKITSSEGKKEEANDYYFKEDASDASESLSEENHNKPKQKKT